MEIKSKVFKRKTGKSKGKWIVRIQYFDDVKGRLRYVERHATKRTDATDERDKLIAKIQKTQGQIQTGDKMTFDMVSAICQKHFYKPAVIVEGRKIAGVKSYRTVKGHLTMLGEFFGPRMIRHITPESLIDYKLWRVEKGSQRGKPENKGKMPVSLATVNRELSSLRAIMKYAFDNGWIIKELSFKKIIDSDAENVRTRILSPEEESRLLSACQGTRTVPYERTRHGRVERIVAVHEVDNPRLKAVILLAIDGGMRKGEILKSDWPDYDFENGIIRIRSANTKTERSRLAPLSDRAARELKRIHCLSPQQRPFPITDFSGSFETACKLAEIKDLQFRDLRTTAITRWQIYGMPLAFAGKMAGHSQLQTTNRHYTMMDEQMVSEAAKELSSRTG